MINIIGLGYIGLPTALMFSKCGLKVVGTDICVELVEKLSNGTVTFDEVGMTDLFKHAQTNGIKFTTNYQKTSLYVIAVPTPYIEENKKLDPLYIITSVNQVLDVCEKGAIIIIESTVSPGTIDRYVRPEIEKRGLIVGKDIHIAHAPERIIPGNMIFELTNNSRTIGVDDISIGKRIKELYSKFCESEIIITDIRSAEMSKVVENTFRDVNIAFANELARICRSDNMDVYEIIRIANMHPRVNILQPGPGVGGHCISVDPWFLVGDYPENTKLILSAREVNDAMPEHVLNRICDIMKQNNILSFDQIGIYGLTYKENVDDTRESPSYQLLKLLNKRQIDKVKTFDPFVNDSSTFVTSLTFDDFINSIELIVVMVAHDHIKTKFDAIKNKLILDTRNIWNDNSIYKI